MVVEDNSSPCWLCEGYGFVGDDPNDVCVECEGWGEAILRNYVQLLDKTNLDIDIPF